MRRGGVNARGLRAAGFSGYGTGSGKGDGDAGRRSAVRSRRSLIRYARDQFRYADEERAEREGGIPWVNADTATSMSSR